MYSVGPTISFSFSISGLILASMYMGGGLGYEVVIVSFSFVRFWCAWNLFVIGISISQFFLGCILVSFRVGAVVAFLVFRVIFLFLVFCIFHWSSALLFASVSMYKVSIL